MNGFKTSIIDLLQKNGYVITKSVDNKSKFFVEKNKTTVTMSLSREGTALLQYYTTTNLNIKDFFDNGNSDSEIIETIEKMFDVISKIQKIEAKISKKNQEILKLKEEILQIHNN